MTAQFFIKILVGFLPVLCFLGSLVYLDSYKLVRPRWIVYAIAAGGLAAVPSYFVNVTILAQVDVEATAFSRYIAPVVEEVLKGATLLFLIRTKRVGFLVDTAIFGFAIGTGFALVENIYYMYELEQSRVIIWIVRGFGTAIMHGGTTTIFGIISKTVTEQRNLESLVYFAPGMLVAIVLHSVFNHFFVSPMLSAVAVVVLLLPIVLVVFRRSETSLEKWLGVGLDADAELLALMQSGEFSESRIGNYLQSLRDRFKGEVLADMLCYLRLHVELSIKAKGVLLMRESGFSVPPDPEVKAKFDELRYLERSIGATGKLAIMPFVHTGSHDLWQLHMLGRE
jgi:RsiW-degrading membrane proteinase PrsW (M82 family)